MLEKDIAEAIQKNLSAEVGQLLKNRLAKADTDEELARSLQVQLTNEKLEVEKLKGQLATYRDIANREIVVKSNEVALREREWELKVKEAELKGRMLGVDLNHDIVKAVFANSRFKYSETGHMPVSAPPGYSHNTGSFSKSIDQEG